MDTFREHLADSCKHTRSEAPVQDSPKIQDEHYVKAFQSWRLQFCEELVACMPRELRDMVYGNSVGHEYVVRLHPRKTVLGLPPVEWFPPLSQDVAPLFSSRNVGAQFAAEISSFIDSRKSLDVLGRSQLKSVIKSPNLPRGLRIHWWRRDESYSPWYNISGNTPGWYTLLETLLMCHPRGLAAMEIVLHFSEPTRCTRLLRRIAPAVFQFKDMGVGISVVRSCVSKKNNFPGLPAAYPRTEYDLTWLFDGTLKDFKEKIFICGRTRNLRELGRLYKRVGPRDGFVRPRTVALEVPK